MYRQINQKINNRQFDEFCVLVLGSHRSGTSVLAYALSVLGVKFGNDLMAPTEFNPKGYFEDNLTYQVNERYLDSIACRWDTLVLSQDDGQQAVSEYQYEIKKNIFSRFRDNKLWGLKDPRISRLWQLWIPAFRNVKIEPVFILANRHPYSIVSSLLKRDHLPRVHALALWAVHQLEALEALLQYGGLVVDYDQLLDRPQEELLRIAKYLGLEEQIKTDEIAKFENEFLDENLRHSNYNIQLTNTKVTKFQAACIEFYNELLKLAQLPGGLTVENTVHVKSVVTSFRRELDQSNDWMQAIDSLQVGLKNAAAFPVDTTANRECEARLYLMEKADGATQIYTEKRSIAATYSTSSQRQILQLQMPVDLRPLSRIRIDPANQLVAIWLHRLALEQADGLELWRWDGDVDALSNVSGLVIRARVEGQQLLCMNRDPQLDLSIPGDVLSNVTAHTSLVVELTPRPLLEVVSEVFSQDEQLITKLSANLSELTSLGIETSQKELAAPLQQLVSDLETITSLVTSSIGRRDKIIIQQSKQLEIMREKLLRAEAQLDLLNDEMLGGREEDRL